VISLSAELLSLSSEPALLLRGGRIIYMNPAAEAVLGKCKGKGLKTALGDQYSDIQSQCYTGEITVNGRPYIMRLSGDETVKAVFLSPADNMPEVMSESFLYALRDSLMGMNISLEMARELALDRGDNKSLEKLRDINMMYHHMNRLSGNMSVIAGVLSNSYPFHPTQFDLVPELLDIVDTVGILTGHRELIHEDFPATLPVCGDRNMLCQLFMELIANALTHSGCSHIGTSLLVHNGTVILAVDDDGCGIASEELHTVFDRYRHRKKLTDVTSGAGLGLTAARLAARLHGGTLILESRPDKGTTVRVSLGKRLTGEYLESPSERDGTKMSDILTAFSGCLNPECYGERFCD